MIFVPVAHYLSQRLRVTPPCRICKIQPVETAYKLCKECMGKQTKRVANWGRKKT
jgi:hypothetical protein